MAVAIKHITKVNAKKLRKMATNYHGVAVSVCLQKEIWGRKDCTIDVKVSVWCARCGCLASIKEFIEKHGGE